MNGFRAPLMRWGALCGVLLIAGAAAAQPLPEPPAGLDEKEPGWTASAELSLVSTSGNSEAGSFGLRTHAERAWERSLLVLDAAALRAEESRITRRAIGATPEDVVLEESSDSEPTAESYLLRGQYDRLVSERLFWFAGGGWERDRFAGIDARLSAVFGAGNVWADREGFQSRTRYGVTWTREKQTHGEETDFAGVRLSWNLLRRLNESTTFTNALTLDENVDETSDYRAETLAAVAVSMTSRLALKVSAHLKYDHQPALVAVPRVLPEGTPAGDTVLVPLEELDTILSASVVISF